MTVVAAIAINKHQQLLTDSHAVLSVKLTGNRRCGSLKVVSHITVYYIMSLEKIKVANKT